MGTLSFVRFESFFSSSHGFRNLWDSPRRLRIVFNKLKGTSPSASLISPSLMTAQNSPTFGFPCSGNQSIHVAVHPISSFFSLLWYLIEALADGSFVTDNRNLVLTRLPLLRGSAVVSFLLFPWCPVITSTISVRSTPTLWLVSCFTCRIRPLKGRLCRTTSLGDPLEAISFSQLISGDLKSLNAANSLVRVDTAWIRSGSSVFSLILGVYTYVTLFYSFFVWWIYETDTTNI